MCVCVWRWSFQWAFILALCICGENLIISCCIKVSTVDVTTKTCKMNKAWSLRQMIYLRATVYHTNSDAGRSVGKSPSPLARAGLAPYAIRRATISFSRRPAAMCRGVLPVGGARMCVCVCVCRVCTYVGNESGLET